MNDNIAHPRLCLIFGVNDKKPRGIPTPLYFGPRGIDAEKVLRESDFEFHLIMDQPAAHWRIKHNSRAEENRRSTEEPDSDADLSIRKATDEEADAVTSEPKGPFSPKPEELESDHFRPQPQMF